MTRDQMIGRMVRDDIGMIRRDLEKQDIEFLDNVLRGDGWKPYNQLSDEEIKSEYEDRKEDIEDHEDHYDAVYGEERNK